MKDIIPAKKQSPILGLTGMGGGVGSNIVAGLAEEPKYIDEVFSNYLYDGTAGSQSITTGLNMAKGGMTWIKARTQNFEHGLFDTERGNNILQSNSNIAQVAYADGLTSFNNDGFTLGADTSRGVVNQDTWDYFSWNFRERKGFFDIVTWTGNGVDGRQISHNLGCVPGFVMIKCTSDTENWACYHRDWPGKVFELDTTTAGTSGIWKNTTATDTYISVNAQGKVNANGQTYVGYFFAGGESTAATARSVLFDGSDYLTLAATSDLDFGSGDFTLECWFYVNDESLHQTFISDWDNNGYQVEIQSGKCQFAWGPNSTAYWSIVGKQFVPAGTWNHLAVVRNGNTFTQYLNGTWDGSFTSSTSAATNGVTRIARNSPNSRHVVGRISNVRIAKGQAIYTSSFRAPTAPLTTTSQGATASNVKLLCCNSSTNTGSTVTPVTINQQGNPTAITNSPFDDPEGFKFGENEDQNLIKCGSYIGDNSNFPEITNLGWEPSWVMIKRTDSNDNWVVWDSMRGLVSGGDDNAIYPDLTNGEGVSSYIDLMPNGFKFTRQSGMVNNGGSTYFYVAIRRSDGYVGKPSEAGTDVFTTDVGTSGSGNPGFDSGFPVDFAIIKQPAGNGSWNASARLMQGRYLQTDNTNSGGSDSSGTLFDYNNGYYLSGSLSDWNAWMWKRHAGLDVVTYVGNGVVGRQIPHNLSKTPEMIWVKNRSITQAWKVYHKGLNGGTNPWEYSLNLNDNAVEVDDTQFWNDTAPTSTHITTGGSTENNHNGSNHIMWLFASVAGISKCGYYSGNGSSNLTITTGFQPRFLLIKRSDGAGAWHLFDSLRGMGATDKLLQLNSTSAQLDVSYVIPSSTGWTTEGTSLTNGNYIYYAHA